MMFQYWYGKVHYKHCYNFLTVLFIIPLCMVRVHFHLLLTSQFHTVSSKQNIICLGSGWIIIGVRLC